MVKVTSLSGNLEAQFSTADDPENSHPPTFLSHLMRTIDFTLSGRFTEPKQDDTVVMCTLIRQERQGQSSSHRLDTSWWWETSARSNSVSCGHCLAILSEWISWQGVEMRIDKPPQRSFTNPLDKYRVMSGSLQSSSTLDFHTVEALRAWLNNTLPSLLMRLDGSTMHITIASRFFGSGWHVTTSLVHATDTSPTPLDAVDTSAGTLEQPSKTGRRKTSSRKARRATS